MTTLKERLLEDFDTLVDTYRASRQVTRAMLDTYAIGRWVSVEERFPEDGTVVITKWGDGFISYYTFRKGEEWCVRATDSEVTHWLDLSLPSGKGEE